MSDEGTYRHLLVERRGAVARATNGSETGRARRGQAPAAEGAVVQVTLNRPEVRNAFNAELIADLQRCFATLGADERVRAIVLAGAGPLFSAGADLNWMRASLDYTREENIADALRMSDMFTAIDTCPKPVVGRIHGAALGGGVGLACVCDVVIAAEGTRFGLTEVRLGIGPAVISPFVLRRIGAGYARALGLTGEQFDATRAREIGLAHRVVPMEQLDAAVEETLKNLLSSGPMGIKATKTLFHAVPGLGYEAARQLTAETIAALRTSQEGQEGIRAFLEKRSASWAE
ncbi:MAG TPA: enoyl-CoA hydratase-related protein [Ktedonobacterales bacterium]|jgi:methylglutaconyl-CoA hydratase